MTEYGYTPLPADLTFLRVEGEVPFPPQIEVEVDALWARIVAEKGDAVFDGQLMGVVGPSLADQVSTGTVRFQQHRFRYHAAKLAKPSLNDALKLRSCGVLGLLRLADGRLIMGKRNDTVLIDPGCWQFAPTGAVDERAAPEPGPVDIIGQIIIEAEEELGISAEVLTDLRVVGCASSADRGVHNLIVSGTVTMSEGELYEAFARRPDPELVDLSLWEEGAPLPEGPITPGSASLFSSILNDGKRIPKA